MSALARWIELLAMFLLAPAVLAIVLPGRAVFPAIWLLALICAVLLVRDETFDRTTLWNWGMVRPAMPRLLTTFAIGAAALTVILVLIGAPLLEFPRQRPGFWTLVMVAYPVLSVYPQELAFRAFFVHRYHGIIRGQWTLALVNGAAFGLAHLLMHNVFAVVFSAVGGVLFCRTFQRTRSLPAACVEHALFGCFIFTIGWGRYFFAGAVR